MNKIHRTIASILLVLLISIQAWGKPTTAPSYVGPADVDVAALIAPPPTDDSAQHREEVAAMLVWQEKRTPEQVERCKAEEAVTPFYFSGVLGEWFDAEHLPRTRELLRKSTADAKLITEAVKYKYNRVRPMLADPRIHPCVVLEKTPSYPSGHATRGIVWATILAEIFPEEREKLLAWGKMIGDDRVVAGMHYPSDVAAGQTLGKEIAARLLANPAFHEALAAAAEECHAVAHAGAGAGK